MSLQRQVREQKEALRVKEEEIEFMNKTYNAKTLQEVMSQNEEYYNEICELKKILKDMSQRKAGPSTSSEKGAGDVSDWDRVSKQKKVKSRSGKSVTDDKVISEKHASELKSLKVEVERLQQEMKKNKDTADMYSRENNSLNRKLEEVAFRSKTVSLDTTLRKHLLLGF